MLSRFVPVAEVARILGHSNPVVTMRVYAHWQPDQRGLAARAMAGVLYGHDEAAPEGHLSTR